MYVLQNICIIKIKITSYFFRVVRIYIILFIYYYLKNKIADPIYLLQYITKLCMYNLILFGNQEYAPDRS